MKRAVVDTHVHLYDPAQIRYGWMEDKPPLQSRHLLQELDAARGDVEIAGIVWIEVGSDPGQHLQEAKLVAELVGHDPRVKGMVASAPLERGDNVREDLKQLAALPLVKGIRRLLQNEADAAFCLQPPFIEGVRLLPRFGLSFDLCIYHPQLANVIELVRRCPDVQFMLDHIGKPGIKDGLIEPWRREITELASLPNVYCKISGVITEADHANWTREQLRPYIRHVAESFGSDRIAFGSDWPVSQLTHRYAEWVEIVAEALGDLNQDEQRKLFRDNATAFYRLGDGST